MKVYLFYQTIPNLEPVLYGFTSDKLRAAIFKLYRPKLKEVIKSHHIDRLQTGDCGIEGGIALVDLVTSFERIASHCGNVSLHIVKRVGNDHNFDEMHGHTNDNFSEEYKALYHYYESQYISPIAYETRNLSSSKDKSGNAKKDTATDTAKNSIRKKEEKQNRKKFQEVQIWQS